MKVTIKDIAALADVSIATVSHVLNNTRYVSPELVSRVEEAIKETGYALKANNREYQLRVGRFSEVAYVFPHMESTTYTKVGNIMSDIFAQKGYTLSAYPTSDDPLRERKILIDLLSNKRIAGIIFVPASENPKKYKALLNSNMPLVCLDRTMNLADVSSVLSENVSALYNGTMHLIRSGHEKIGIIVDDKESTTSAERLEGYKIALRESNIDYNDSFVFKWGQCDNIKSRITNLLTDADAPSAFIASTNHLTREFLKIIGEFGITYPKDISIVGFGDDDWCSVINPPLTTLNQNPNSLAQLAVEMLLEGIENKSIFHKTIRLPMELKIRNSTRCIEKGPEGTRAISPEQITLTTEEINRLKSGNFKVGISFHCGGTEWARLYERAIRETLAKYGVNVVAVTEAQFDPDLQIAQLQSLRMQKLDALISLPADEQKMADIYENIAKETKLIMIGNLPPNLNPKDYCAFISVNERENGQNAGRLLGDFFSKRESVKVGLITHGAPLTMQRDHAAEQVLSENYKNIELVAKENFYRIDNAYHVAKKMMQEHPEIEGLYVSWEIPALEVIRALDELGRTDVSITTTDLDHEIASYMARGEFVCGISAQKPYEQGEAAALAVARALIGKTEFIYVGVQPQVVTPLNLRKAWVEIMHTGEPTFLHNADDPFSYKLAK